MKHDDAKILLKMYEVERTQNRHIYSGDLVSAHIIPINKSQKKLEEFRDMGFLDEYAVHGANAYKVNRKAIYSMSAYRDIRSQLLLTL